MELNLERMWFEPDMGEGRPQGWSVLVILVWEALSVGNPTFEPTGLKTRVLNQGLGRGPVLPCEVLMKPQDLRSQTQGREVVPRRFLPQANWGPKVRHLRRVRNGTVGEMGEEGMVLKPLERCRVPG